mgnify:CR=1 FL=1
MLLVQGGAAVGLLLAMLLGLLWIGELVVNRLRQPSLPAGFPNYSFSVGLGIAGLSTLVMGLAMLGWLYPLVLAIVSAGLGLAGLLRLWRGVRSGEWARMLSWGGIHLLPVAALALLAAPFLLLPPIGWDALVYHLEVPRQYLLHQGALELARNPFSYAPQGIDLLYAGCLALLPPFAAQFVHFGFLLLSLFAVIETVHAVGSLPAVPRLVSVMLQLGAALMPTFFLSAIGPYVDVGLTFFGTLVVAGIFVFLKSRRTEDLYPVLVAAGFLPAIKLTGVVFMVMVLTALGIAAWRARIAWPPLRPLVVILLLACLVFAAPYYVRNAVWTGNPVFPFLNGLLGHANPSWTPDQDQVLWYFLDRYGSGLGSPWLYPLNLAVMPFVWRLEVDQWFDGALGPFLLVWALLWWRAGRRLPPEDRFLAWFCLCYGVVWAIWLRQARFLLPVAPTMLLFNLRAAALLAGSFWRRTVWIGAAGVILAFNLGVLGPELARLPVAKYLSGRLDVHRFLVQQVPAYDAQRFINRNTPPEARVWLMCTLNKNFYLEREYLADYILEDVTFHRWLLETDDPGEVRRRFRELGVTHLLLNPDAVLNPALYSEAPLKRELALRFLQGHARPLYLSNGFLVCALQ